MNTIINKQPWQVLILDNLDVDHSIQIGVYYTGSYSSIEEAERSGGIYIARNPIHGRVMAEQCVDGMNAAQDCLDGSKPLVIIYREI